MFDDEDKKPGAKGPKPLDDMSVDELREYIEDMKVEIERVEQEIARKDAHKDQASAFFKS